MTNQDKILILDFGSQVTQLIARRVREAHVYCELHSFDMPLDEIKAFNPKGIILSGGPNSVYESDYQADVGLFDLGVPVLGICYGMQFMAHHLGGEVSAGNQREFGYAQVKTIDCELTRDIHDGTPNVLDVWMSHGDKVSKLPMGFAVIGDTPSCPIAMMEHAEKQFYGIQFHPEVTHTKQGKALLNRFVLDICGAKPSWTMPNYIEEAIVKIREQVGNEEVILGLSGGVDSSVAAALIHRAIGDQLTCVFVDHGLLRLNEGKNVMDMFARNLGVKVVHIDATEQFMSKLAGVTDPEQKRKIIGAEFVEVFDAEEKKLTNAKWLAQGTIYPDVIESAGAKTKKAHAIKSHHNVGGLPENMKLKLLEPLRDLFKDEVRELGVALGLPREMVYRHPFPGPGLGVRILGEVKREYADLLRRADDIFIEELRNTIDEQSGKSWYDLTSQAFAVFLPVKSVGVMGDGRTYDYVVALRAVVTSDFMTAHWAELPYSLLGKVSNRIINEIRGINRVVYDVSGKPPATIEWE
ncbi:glutamine-hydrolyzing GMP synthase [Kingella kingae]|uniref:glutamine-hydrolyzing GMP synthase n=1 Tax=Kingella kingae TaxID=504 RepID=UPI0004043A53|nr:glutamine-hydrolyzing GMP synthase [Kingella kingae]MDK4545040.1 glutamine-hydrolyzing GMP synthase [Kingella kingae]MDK4580572.1 glutamine-hydrolyzing GMP synthase [Kingella kingae]MDK4628864.1 glutamine-hydrolyzing GMP synthase [Kingella kingae]MDK4636722.1 glutamine-hydrolyzing GMP synthase [Kingella kingae]MDK4672344.1 glutamine-hydrolyzing GMP synthase [Kingella kingae]